MRNQWRKRRKRLLVKMEKKKPCVGVGVMLFRDGKVLLGKRQDNKDKEKGLKEAGTWTMPGGKLEYQEDFIECGKRETFEECGLVLNNVKVICVNNDKNENAHFVTIGLFSDDFTGEAQALELDKITEWKWFSLDELPDSIFFPSEKLIKNYQEKKFFI